MNNTIFMKEGIHMQDYKQAARDFIDNEKQFHLGPIPTAVCPAASRRTPPTA